MPEVLCIVFLTIGNNHRKYIVVIKKELKKCAKCGSDAVFVKNKKYNSIYIHIVCSVCGTKTHDMKCNDIHEEEYAKKHLIDDWDEYVELYTSNDKKGR